MNTVVHTKPVKGVISGGVSMWHHTFQIPERETFSGCVQQSIDTGIVSARARREIVQMLRTLIVQHTKYPTSEQYNTVCNKLVTKFKSLKDTLGSGHVSW